MRKGSDRWRGRLRAEVEHRVELRGPVPGWSYADIGRRFGVSAGQVGRLVRAAGLLKRWGLR